MVAVSASRAGAAANSANRPTQALSSLAPLLQCTIATRSPAGVVTRSSSGCTRLSSRSSTTIAKMLVPALTLPVRGATELVATMPVPASPSGGHIGMPARSSPGRVEQRRPRFGQLAGRLPGDQDVGSMSASLRSTPARRRARRMR